MGRYENVDELRSGELSVRDVFLHDWSPGQTVVSQGQYEGVLGETEASVPLELSVDSRAETLNLLLREDEQ